VAHAFLELLVLVSVGLVVYSYAVYPLVLTCVAGVVQTIRDARYVIRKAERRLATETDLPQVAVVISAFNEERHVQSRVENLLALDYPAHLLHVYIGSDGSTDRTNEILAAFRDQRVHGFPFERNRGKSSVLNDLVGRADADILVFSDANTQFDRQALRRLVAHFTDPRVGAVSGELRLRRSAGDNQDSLYWRVEQYLKFFEARIGGLLGANGAIYAIRRPLWQPLATDTICDDFCVAMNVAASQHKLVYEPTAWADEDTPDAIGDEYKRRVRIGIGNFQALVRHPRYLYGTSPGTIFAYVSHKVLRWIAPHLLVIALLASCVLAIKSEGWRLATLVQVGIYAGAWVTYQASCRQISLPGPLRILAFLFALNWALFVASYRYTTGRYSGSWRRTDR